MSVNEDNIDTLHSKVILLLGDECVICGERDRQKLTCGHLFSRYFKPTAWDTHQTGNCHIQCMLCNGLHEEDDGPYTEWFISKFGQDIYDILDMRHNSEIYNYGEFVDSEYQRLVKEYNALDVFW